MRPIPSRPWVLIAAQVALACGAGPQTTPSSAPTPAPVAGESIVAAGVSIPIGTRVILWTDPGGFNAYAPSTAPKAGEKPIAPGFGRRKHNLSEAQLAEIERTGWTLPLLQQNVDQFVIHYDVCGTSRRCFDVLNTRTPPLSVQFMLDLDGTIYQSLDLKEASYHATKANGRSIGIEIANMGAYPPAELATSPLATWYARDAAGRAEIKLPAGATVPTYSAAGPLRPSRDEPVAGKIQGQELVMYDLTPQQYAALAKLTAALCATFPKIRPDVPRDEKGQVVDRKLDDDVYNRYQGILGHFHVSSSKTDPGPAFRWDQILPPVATAPRP